MNCKKGVHTLARIKIKLKETKRKKNADDLLDDKNASKFVSQAYESDKDVEQIFLFFHVASVVPMP